MAITMVFGIAVATGIVLVVVPSLLGIIDDIGKFMPTIWPRIKRFWGRLRGRLPSPEGRA